MRYFSTVEFTLVFSLESTDADIMDNSETADVSDMTDLTHLTDTMDPPLIPQNAELDPDISPEEINELFLDEANDL